ncbi:MAG: MipA/OmpV family protein [Aliidiomarina sp.]|uniref:MipA/OmpV family protein n=1 Tax=Aliidiomarina sp. TaxID=1872439 RepID=UPI0025B83CB0|nr:MipA/OmpV family protein [Aliidiomarina sp.]MCH8500719.1 MipA/OmpV family protein [Aliidiomarina sp.]
MSAIHAMPTVYRTLSAVALATCLCLPVKADEADTSFVEDFNEQLKVFINELNIRVAMGYGERSSIVRGTDPLSFYVLPDVSYYGERFFFDNGMVGYSLKQGRRHEVSLFTKLNTEFSFFTDSITGYWFGDAYSGVSSFRNPSPSGGWEDEPPSVDNIAKRSWAIDAGIRGDYYPADYTHIGVILSQDIRNKHRGQWASVMVSQGVPTALGNFNFKGELTYKSQDLVDYYYGVSSRDNVAPNYYYRGRSVVQPALSVHWQYPLSDRLSIVGSGRYMWLGDGVADSPLITKDTTTTFFLGVSYAL